MIRRPPRSPLFPHPPLSRSENMYSDNRLCVELVKSLLEQCNLFGYGQIKQGWYPAGTLMSVYSQEIDNPKFVGVTIEDKEDVYPALQKFFSVKEPAGRS